MFRFVLVSLAAACLGALFTPAAFAAPRILHARLLAPPVAGTYGTLMIRVRDPLASVNGIQVAFGDGSSTKVSACRPDNGAPFLPLGAFAPGRAADFVVNHLFTRAGKLDIAVVAMAGDCVHGVAMAAMTLHPTVHESKAPLHSTATARVAQARTCPDALALPGSVSEGAMRTSLTCLVNAVREAQGKPALVTKKSLQRAAERHAADMVARGYFAHESPNGHGLRYRLRHAKFPFRGPAGENIAAGTAEYATAGGTLVSWLNSPPHRANLFEAGFTMAGVGIAPGMPGISEDDAATYVLDLAGRE